MLTEEELGRIEVEAAKYPDRRAALSEALMIVQESRRWVDDAALADVARAVGVSPASAESVATFYELVFRRPVGRHVIMVCDSVSCWLRGSGGILRLLEAKLGIALGETTADGAFTLLPAGCLGLCEFAPAMMLDGEVYGDLTLTKLGEIIQSIRERDHGDPAQR